MKVQTALRIDQSIIDSARRAAERQNRSLANFVETALAETLIDANGDIPVLSVLDDDILDGAVALSDSGEIDEAETARFEHLAEIARRERGE